jgi:hypothetical protein
MRTTRTLYLYIFSTNGAGSTAALGGPLLQA